MTCANHPEAPVAAYCRTCGKPLCAECRREAQGTIFCEEHVPVAAAAPPPPVSGPSAPPPRQPLPPYAVDPGTSPVLAFILGFIPGVGAIYNGQYAKGLIHAVVFGIMVSILSSRAPSGMEPLFGILLAVWIFYMAIEAYHTARKRRDGERVEEFSSLIEINRAPGRLPIGPVVLIGLGGLLLLDTTDIISLDRLIRFWPAGLILLGVYMLWARLDVGSTNRSDAHSGVPNDRR